MCINRNSQNNSARRSSKTMPSLAVTHSSAKRRNYLFHANSNDMLKRFLDNQRTQRAAKGDGVTLTDVPFDGLEQSASLLASLDNRVRSFYVSSGDFHLITTSPDDRAAFFAVVWIANIVRTPGYSLRPHGHAGESQRYRIYLPFRHVLQDVCQSCVSCRDDAKGCE